MKLDLKIIVEFNTTGLCYLNDHNIESSDEIGISLELFEDIVTFNNYAVNFYAYNLEILKIYPESAYMADSIGFILKHQIETELLNNVFFYSPSLNNVLNDKPNLSYYNTFKINNLHYSLKRIAYNFLDKKITPKHWIIFYNYIINKYR